LQKILLKSLSSTLLSSLALTKEQEGFDRYRSQNSNYSNYIYVIKSKFVYFVNDAQCQLSELNLFKV